MWEDGPELEALLGSLHLIGSYKVVLPVRGGSVLMQLCREDGDVIFIRLFIVAFITDIIVSKC